MMTMLTYYSVKPDRVEVFKEMAKQIVTMRHGQDDGCSAMIVHQESANRCEFAVYEQWRDQPSLDAFVARVDVMFSHLGGIDAVIADLVEETHTISYDVVC